MLKKNPKKKRYETNKQKFIKNTRITYTIISTCGNDCHSIEKCNCASRCISTRYLKHTRTDQQPIEIPIVKQFK